MALKQSRRNFIKTASLLSAGLTGVSAGKALAAEKTPLSEDRMGVLVDTTVCIGCRSCEWACKTAHNLTTSTIETYQERSVMSKMRRPDENGLTVVNEYPARDENSMPIDVKVQCMHCDHPACVSACIVGAFKKNETGAVTWETSKCIGCRYCMVACPFQIPAFEYKEALYPKIKKCDFCYERTSKGLLPACVEICPVETLTYGNRNELVKIARDRIKRFPERYTNHIYGEYEVGGTSWLYIAGEDFAKLDFPKLGRTPAPGISETIQHGIFAYFVPPVSLFALLGGLMWMTKKRQELEEE